MGIKGLIPFLNEKVPGCMCELTLESLSGEYVAVDASTALYQFSIAIRDSSYFNSLVNSNGESTSHLYGLMSRSLKLLESGIKPVFVFDSKPPDLKLKTLDKRRQKREEAKDMMKQAISEGDVESIKKLVGRTVKVSKEMNESAKKLLRFMGLPVIEALEEAEAQCAYLVRNNLCRFVASEDTDTLVFGGNFLLRNVTASSNKKILKVDLEKVLTGLELTFDKFVDFCILCGCDYCDTLEGVGPKTAYTLVKRYNTLEDIVRIKGADYENFKEAREYFLAPKVNEYDQGSVKMGNLDVEALTEFLVTENNFSKERVDRFIEKLLKLKTKKVQTSLLSFLTKSNTLNKPIKDLSKKGKGNKITTSFRNTNKGTSVKKQKIGLVENNKREVNKENKEEEEYNNNNKEETEREDDMEKEDDEFFDKLFNLDGDDLDQPANDEVDDTEQLDENRENNKVEDTDKVEYGKEEVSVKEETEDVLVENNKEEKLFWSTEDKVKLVEVEKEEIEVNEMNEDNGNNKEETLEETSVNNETENEVENKMVDEMKENKVEQENNDKEEEVKEDNKQEEAEQDNKMEREKENKDVELTENLQVKEQDNKQDNDMDKEMEVKEEKLDDEPSSYKTDQNLEKEIEQDEQRIELKLFNSKRVLDEDDDNMSTATSEKMNCDVSDIKKKEEKKGLRNLFDVLLAYPKPTKKHKN